MNEALKTFFEEWGIEYFSTIAYSDCREINGAIMARESFTPKSVVVFLIPYYAGEAENLSVYAASLDYHIIIRTITSALIERLSALYPAASFRGYGDHSPIDERHAALVSGLGILGDSGLLINEKYGTYVFIADVVTDLEPVTLGAITPREITACSHCGACRRACPTGALIGRGECLSAITQKKGELTPNEVEMMRKFNTVWGCDLCQGACPHNNSPKKTPVGFFYRDRITRLTSEVLASLSGKAFKERAFAWRGRSVVERNLKYLDS